VKILNFTSKEPYICRWKISLPGTCGGIENPKSINSQPHWGIENGLLLVLDIAFDKDRCRVRKDHGAAIFAVLRHIALNLLKQEKTSQRGIKGKRLLAGWKEEY